MFYRAQRLGKDAGTISDIVVELWSRTQLLCPPREITLITGGIKAAGEYQITPQITQIFAD